MVVVVVLLSWFIGVGGNAVIEHVFRVMYPCTTVGRFRKRHVDAKVESQCCI